MKWKKKRRYNAYGVPIFTPEESAKLDKHILSAPCKACGAKPGKACKGLLKGPMVTPHWPPGDWRKRVQCHLGRLPKGFDSEKVVDAFLDVSDREVKILFLLHKVICKGKKGASSNTLGLLALNVGLAKAKPSADKMSNGCFLVSSALFSMCKRGFVDHCPGPYEGNRGGTKPDAKLWFLTPKGLQALTEAVL